MLTRPTRLKLLAFALVGVLVLAFAGFHYAKLGRYFGASGYYVVRLELADGGGIYPNADVTYRGVPVGRIGSLSITATGIEADLDISDSAPPIPARLQAAVADLSAVGEQYVDLRPQASSGPYLVNGSVIPQRDSQLPLPVTSLLTSINGLSTSLPLDSLRALTSELATGFAGQGSNLQALVDGNSSLAQAAYATLPQTKTLISNSKTVLATQIAEAGSLDAFGRNALLLARQLAKSNSSLRQLISAAPQAAAQVADLLAESNPSLATLIANLLTTSEVTLTRGSALDELLSVLPAGCRDRLDGDQRQGRPVRHCPDLLQAAALYCRIRRHRLPEWPGHLPGPGTEHQRRVHAAREQWRGCARVSPCAVRRRSAAGGAAGICPVARGLAMTTMAGQTRAGGDLMDSALSGRGPGWRRDPLLATASVLLLAAIVFAAWAGVSWLSAPRPSAAAQSRDAALRAGEQDVLNFNTLDYKTVAQGAAVVGAVVDRAPA